MSTSGELQRVLTALPHREPFRFVTELTSLEPSVRATGAWIVRGDEYYFAGHFPEEPIVPGVLLAESLAQLCGLVAFGATGSAGPPGRAARLAQIEVKIHSSVRPPARIELSAVFIREMGGLLLFEVAAEAGGVAAAGGRIVLARAS